MNKFHKIIYQSLLNINTYFEGALCDEDIDECQIDEKKMFYVIIFYL